MFNKITNMLLITIESSNALDELANFLTEYINYYYKFKEIHNIARFYIGNKGHVFRITAEADQMSPWATLNQDSMVIEEIPKVKIVNDKEFSKWEVNFEELVYNLNLEPNFMTYGIIPTYSYKFPMKQVKQFVYYASLEDEDFYA